MHRKIHGLLCFLFSILNGLQPGMSGTVTNPRREAAPSPPKTSLEAHLPAGTAFSRFGAIPARELGKLGAEFGLRSLQLLPAAS